MRLGTLTLELSAPTAQLQADLRRAEEMVKASNKQWEIKPTWGIAASLHDEMRATRSILNSSLKGMESDAKGYQIKVGVEIGDFNSDGIKGKIDRINGLSIEPKVDDRALTALNAHLTLKEQHLDRVVSRFATNKITPIVDDQQLTALNGLLDRVSGNRQIGIKLGSGDDLSKDITQSIEKGFKSAKGNLATNVVSKAVDTATSPFRSIARGAMENFGKALTDPFSQGIAGALNDAISGTVGSQKLVGEKIGETIASSLREKIGKSLGGEIKDLAKETLGQENIDREYGSSKSKSRQSQQNQTTRAAEQLNLDRQNLGREYYQDLAQSEEIKAKQSRVSKVRAAAESKLVAATEATYDAKASGASPQRVSRLERVELGRRSQLAAVDEFAANLGVEQATVEARLSRNKTDRTKLTDRIDTLSPVQNRTYQQISESAAGRKLNPNEAPSVVVADALLSKIGGNAAYNEEANVMLVRSTLDQQAQAGKLSGKNTETLFHENIHAVDQGFGSIEGIRAGKRGDVITNRQLTANEVAFAMPYVERYPESQRKGEMNAYGMQFRNKETFANQDRKLALEPG